MKVFFKIIDIIAVFFLCLSFSAFANTENEIKHLLKYVEQTQCQYERNGSMHTGLEALEHIKKKYRYFLKRIKTTEDFIRLSATQSTMSKKQYRVHCDNHPPLNSKDWLLAELAKYRQAK